MANSNPYPSIIKERIEKLPQELQDEILDWTLLLTSKKATHVLITPEYCPPWQLSVNQRTRRIQAYEYYSNSIFWPGGRLSVLGGRLFSHGWHAWRRSIPEQYRLLVKEGPDLLL